MLREDPTTGYACSSADLLCDQLCECGALDPDWADPLYWGPEHDAWRVELGAPLMIGEEIPDPPAPTPDQLPGEEQPLDPTQPDPDDTGDFEELAPEDEDFDQAAKTWEPSPEDQLDYLDWCERREIERGCTARFA